MKKILLFAGVLTLLTTTGCLVADGGHRGGHAHYEERRTVVVGPPVVEVRAPVVEVRPPELIVR